MNRWRACARKTLSNPCCLERTSDVQPLLDASMPEAAVSTSCSGRSIGRGHGHGDLDFYNDVVREGCSQENHARIPPKTDSKYKFPALYAKFPVWSKVAVISRGSWALEAPGSRPAASQLLACPASPDGHGVHGPQLLHVAVLRVEAPRRVRRCSESACVLHCLDAAVRQVLVVLEPVGVVLEDPELCGRLLLHVFRGAVHRLVGPRVVGRSGLLKVVAPLAALAGHARGQALLQRLDVPVHHGNGVAVLGPLRPVHGFSGQLPVQRGELVAQVCRDHEVPVVPRQLPRGALGGPAHRLGVLVLQRFHGGLPGEDVHHHQAILRLPPRVLAEVDEVGLQPVVRPLGGRLAQRTRPGRPWPASRQGRAASQVGTASARPAR